ncbi:Uncharacterised protein [Serratia rubidaea]|uniref:Uncharacterized protein n=1 Tax=Serratia rubidaea TaxID=61652 RepID=A0A4U9HZG3_SERRU|nr:Uncharacterised protein [Serratia rubidaea]
MSPEEVSQNTPILLCWLSLVLLFRGLLYDQRSMAWGLLAALIWVFIGDTGAAGVWAASMFFMLHLLSQRSELGWIHLWYLLLWLLMLLDYNTMYEGVHHYGYLCIFTALFLLSAYLSLPLSKRVAKTINAATRPAPVKRPVRNKTRPQRTPATKQKQETRAGSAQKESKLSSHWRAIPRSPKRCKPS